MYRTLLFAVIAFCAIAKGFASSSDSCLSYTLSGKCCKSIFEIGNKNYTSCAHLEDGFFCIGVDGQREKCSNFKMPGIGHAYPLGVQNGLVMNSQIYVPDAQRSVSKARLFSETKGWKPSDSYRTTHSKSIECFKNLTRVPKTIVQNAPVYVEVTFLRMKKLMYFIVQGDGTYRPQPSKSNTDRKFVLSYRGFNGRSVVYGMDSILAEVLLCKGMFESAIQQCRFSVRPFRARSVRVSSVDFWVTSDDGLRLEFGGLDYMEADHMWRFDKIRKNSSGTYFPDERGNQPMITDKVITGDRVDGGYAGNFKPSKTASTGPLPLDSCFIDPELCKDGISIGFWFKGVAGGNYQIMGTFANTQTNLGFGIKILITSIQITFITKTEMMLCVHTVSGFNAWNHYVIALKGKTAILFENGQKVTSCSAASTGSSYSASSERSIKIGPSTASEINIYEVKLWTFALSSFDVSEEYNPGSGTKLSRTDNVKKMGPKTCPDAMSEFGKDPQVQEVFTSVGSTKLKCTGDVSTANFSVYHETPEGYFTTASNQLITYEMDMMRIQNLIDGASWCRQTVTFKCNGIKLTGQTTVLGRKSKVLAMSCQNVLGCNCDKTNNVGTVTDTINYNSKEQLPISQISVTGSITADQFLEFTVGPIQCGFVRYDSCGAALAANNNKGGKFMVGNKVTPISVNCELLNGEVKTTISHSNSHKLIYVHGYEAKYSYKQILFYNQNISSIIGIIDASDRCQQLVKLKCHNSVLSSQSILTNRDNQNMGYWAGGPSNGRGCACGITSTCANPNYLCNCDKNDNVNRTDDGYITKKSDLPITSISTGDTGNTVEFKEYVIGDVECFNTQRFVRYESCGAALAANNNKGGKFMVGNKVTPISVNCELLNGEVKTTISHSNSNKLIYVNGYEAKYSYKQILFYNQNISGIISIIDASDRCQQLVKLKCHDSLLSDYSILTNRDNQNMGYWAGGPSNGRGCACGITRTCAKPNRLCNCDKNDYVNRTDDGYITKKSDLPITSISTGDTGYIKEFKEYVIGDVECFGTQSATSVSICAFPFTDSGGKQHSTCTDSNDSYGPWCKNSKQQILYCKTNEVESTDNTMSANASCIFPFKYRNVTYQTCITDGQHAPWCSTTSVYTGGWRYCYSSLPKANIDFTLTVMDNYGGWKLGSVCSKEVNSGPCNDMTFSSKPGEPSVQKDYAEFGAVLGSFSTFNIQNAQCSPNKIKPSVYNSISAVQYRFEESVMLEHIEHAKLSLQALQTSPAVHEGLVYVTVPPDCSDTTYISSCKFSYFKAGVHYGPILWKLGPVTINQWYRSINLAKIIRPALRISTRCPISIVIQWQTIVSGAITLTPLQGLVIGHKSKKPANYLYADSVDAKVPGKPLIYNTRYFIPSFKCLQFWYHMQGAGIGTLAVNINQEEHVAHEILRVRGDQGSFWKKATVPIDTLLNKNGALFNVAFIAIREAGISKRIAIDDISFLPSTCTKTPAFIPTSNLALGKRTSQSSTYEDGYSRAAVDGKRMNYYLQRSCSHTLAEKGPWWMVDMGRIELVSSVNLTNRGDCCNERLSNFDVRVGNNEQEPLSNTLCFHQTSAVGLGETRHFHCIKPLYGRLLFVMLRSNVAAVLTLCEVEIYSGAQDLNSIDASLNLPQPLILIPLDTTVTILGSLNSVTFTAPSKKVPVTDKFGYPVLFTHFSNSLMLGSTMYTSSQKIEGDFSFSAHVRPLVDTKLVLFRLMDSGDEKFLLKIHNGEASLRFNKDDGTKVKVKSKPVLKLNTWTYLTFTYEYHLGLVTIYADGRISERRWIGSVKPKITFKQIVISDAVASAAPVDSQFHIACIQLYNTAVDKNFVKALDVCPNRQTGAFCTGGCFAEGICDQMSGKCVCPSYADRFVFENCSSSIKQNAYKDAVSVVSFDNKGNYKTYPTLKFAKNATLPVHAGVRFYIPGPVNAAICTKISESFTLSSATCLNTGICPSGVSVAFWLLVPPVNDWSSTGNVTIVKFGVLDIQYGIIDDVRGCNNSKVAALFITGPCLEFTCIWFTMIHSTMLVDVWSHITVTLTQSSTLSVYYNGKISPAVKKARSSPAPVASSLLVTSSLAFTCMDEIVYWNKVLSGADVQGIYNAIVNNGNQAIKHAITFKSLTMEEPDSLWGIDKSKKAYRYVDATWKPLEGNDVSIIYSGLQGVYSMRNNALYRREGITTQTPTGTSWSQIIAASAFNGAIVEMGTLINARIIAKSATKWHCVDVLVSPASASTTMTGVTGDQHLKCNLYQCWLATVNNLIRSTASGHCGVTGTTNVNNFDAKRLAGDRYNFYPFALRASDSKIYNAPTPTTTKPVSEQVFVDVAAVNGLPVGITDIGDINLLKNGGIAFFIRHISGYCWGNNAGYEVVIRAKCHTLFKWSPEGCLQHVRSSKYVNVANGILKMKDTCRKLDVLVQDDSFVIFQNETKLCIGVMLSPAYPGMVTEDKKLKTFSNCIAKQRIFFLQPVGNIKNLTSHYFSNQVYGVDNGNVQVEITAELKLYSVKWTESFSNPNSQESLFVYNKLRQELKQHFAGSKYYQKVEFGLLKYVANQTNLLLVLKVECTAQLYFNHFGETERSVLLIPKFRGVWSDCAGSPCKLRITDNSIGVDLKQPRIQFLNSTDTTATFVYHTSYEHTKAAFVGYNVSMTGLSRSSSHIRTVYRQIIHKEGEIFTIRNLPKYFNFTSSIKVMFLQGVGETANIPFQTQESTPIEAPNMTCSAFTTKDDMWVDIHSIKKTSWNGVELGYRFFYRDVQLLDFNNVENITQIQNTYAHADLLLGAGDLMKATLSMNISGLTEFTNYSIVVSAFTNAGIGLFKTIYCRTAEGVPEVAPSNFNATAVNSTHIFANWSALTTDIELLNGWFLSGYTVTVQEVSVPSITGGNITTFSILPNVTEVVIGPLAEGREFQIVVAGNVNGFDGVNTSICVSTEEAVPFMAPRRLEVCKVKDTMIKILTGDVNFAMENGRITHYNVSVENMIFNDINYLGTIFNAGQKCMQRDAICNSTFDCDPADILAAKGREQGNYHLGHRCTSDMASIPKSSFIIKYKINNLDYWTNYSIRVSACTKKGCGIFSNAILVQTDEHAPTCAPTILSIGNSSSTSIALTFEKLSRNCSNGFITHHNIFVAEYEAIANIDCFNASQCWELFDSTKNQKKFYSVSGSLDSEITGLKKYKKYCFSVQAVNIKGFGPPSEFKCVYTAEDIPEGPPVSFKAIAASSTSIRVFMKKPSPDVVNGIITGYVVFYFPKTPRIHDPAPQLEKNRTFNRENENVTVGLIGNLRKFEDYLLFAAAFTSKGLGPRTPIPVEEKTLEDVPSAPPRKIQVPGVFENRSMITFQETHAYHINGILTKFLLLLKETRRDGIQVNTTARLHIKHSNRTESNPLHNNITSSAGNSTGVNGTASLDQALAQLSLDDYVPGGYIEAYSTTTSSFFGIMIDGLIPYTLYNVEIASCTKIGCGPFGNQSFVTDQSVPSEAPEFKVNADKTANELTVSWKNIPIMGQRGIITGYKLKWMKNCLYLRTNNQPPNSDCVRVLDSNNTDFETREIEGSLTSATVGSLTAYTHYLFFICGGTLKGFGACRSHVFITDEDIPCMPPNVTYIKDVTGKSIRIDWDDVPPHCQNGVIQGYYIYYKKLNPVVNDPFSQTTINNSLYGNYSLHIMTSFPPKNTIEIKDLALRTNYSFIISAYTVKGPGPNSTFYFMATGDFKHGNWSEWTEWSFCSASCGGGIVTRIRLCNNPAPFNGGDDCTGHNRESKTCNNHICSGSYLGDIGKSCADSCSAIGYYCKPKLELHNSAAVFEKLNFKCKDKTTKAKWTEKYHPSYHSLDKRCEGFIDVPASVPCNESAPNDGQTRRLCDCVSPDDCGCENWANWGVCSKSCGQGTKTRRRFCEQSAWCPQGRTVQRLECTTKPCPLDGNWGQWSAETPCNVSCGNGYKHRYRLCDSPKPAHNGSDCRGTNVDVIPECNTHKCPIHGNWGAWGEWRACNQPCGGGVSIRKRYCDNPAKRYFGNDCFGDDYESELCNSHKCEGAAVLFQVALTDFIWNFRMVYKTNPETVKIANALIENVKALYNGSDNIAAVNLFNLYEGSVVANFSIFYVQVKQDEILLFQDYVTSTEKVYNLSTVLRNVKPLNALSDPPTNLTAVSKTPFSMLLTWKPPANIAKVVNISGYFVFYREHNSPPGSGSWTTIGVPGLNSTSFNVTDLKPFTKYRFRMSLAIKSGNGPASEEVVQATMEGVPSTYPTNLKLSVSSSGQLYVQWDHIPIEKYNGRNFGYIIKYNALGKPTKDIETVPAGVNEVSLSNIKAFTRYYVDVAALSGAGSGPPIAGDIKTPEGPPSFAPPSVAVQQQYSTTKLSVSWKDIPYSLANGNLLGYKIRYVATHVSNEPAVATQEKSILVSKFTLFTEIKGLISYTKYSVTVVGYTKAGEGPKSTAIIAETCKCPQDIFLNYYLNPPYVVKSNGAITGLIGDFVQSMIKFSCGRCANKEAKVYLTQSLSGENPEKKSQLQVKKSIGNEYHVSFPIFGRSTVRKFMEKHLFVLVVESTGSATIVRNEVDFASTTMNVLKSISNIWPMILIMISFVTVFGIMTWAAERTGNEEFSKGSYFNGACQGFWWAFVSMTTVGYGDITPRTFLGRVVAIIWTLCGLVLSGILLGSLTSSVTTMTLPPSVKLYGAECAAVNDSFEAFLGVRRNSKVNTKAAYQTNKEVLAALERKDVSIALVDAFAAATLQTDLAKKSLKVKEVIKANTGYGIVLSNDFVRLENDFKSFITANQNSVSGFISNMTAKLVVNDDTTTKVPMLFDPTTPLFWQMIKVEGFMLLALSILGLCWSFYLTAKKRKAKITSCQAVYLHGLESLGGDVPKFKNSVNGRLEVIAEKQKNEVMELMRLKKSYKRYTKRKGLDFNSLEQQASHRYNDMNLSTRNNTLKYQVKGHSTGESES